MGIVASQSMYWHRFILVMLIVRFAFGVEDDSLANGEGLSTSLLQAESTRSKRFFMPDAVVFRESEMTSDANLSGRPRWWRLPWASEKKKKKKTAPAVTANGSHLSSDALASNPALDQAYTYAPMTKAERDTVASSGFTAVVGADGSLMIALPKRFGYDYCVGQLRAVGIDPLTFRATDGRVAAQSIVDQGCQNNQASQANGATFKSCASRTGDGCVDNVEAAIADSHRRALLLASQRTSNWTAIFEDDAVPVQRPGISWDLEFRAAWKRVPPTARIIRLSWCLPPGVDQQAEPQSIDVEGGRFQFRQGAIMSGCTAAYMVHKEIIPEMLKVFPCCCAVDCCYSWDLFPRIPNVFFDLVDDDADAFISEHQASDWGTQHGVMMQAKSELPSTRTRR